MQIVEGKLVLSASDLVGYLECAHLTGLDHSAALGRLRAPLLDDPELELIRRHGAQHESAYLEKLERDGLSIVRIARPTLTLTGLRAAHQQTLAAMRAGAEVISQAAFFDGRWLGYADFLLRRDRSSSLGDWSYDVADTKLARRVRAGALLQMSVHAEHLERAQGTPPEQLIVIAGDGVEHSQSFDGVAAYYRSVKRSFEAALRDEPETYPLPVGHCDVCRWAEVCERRRRDDDHLSLVAFMTREQARKIGAAGLTTVAALAAGDTDRIARLGDPTYERLRAQARLQVAQRATQQVGHELATVAAGRGLALLPEPSGGDLFFDMEGDPFAADGGLEYLFGVTEVLRGKPEHHTFWGTGPEHEKRAFEDFIDFVMERLAADPALHVYHYAPYERSALTRLMTRHATREEQVDRLLRGGVLVDLYQVVRQGVRVSQESYSIKKLEPLYMPPRETEITGGGASIIAFERWLETGDEAILTSIGAYNRDDCESTWRLRTWLEGLRTGAIASGTAIARPPAADPEPTKEQRAEDAVIEALATRLNPVSPLLAQLLWWHRREAKPEYWEFFRRAKLSDDELVLDTAAIGALTFDCEVGSERRSVTRRYRFDPAQEHKLKPGDVVVDPRTGERAGTVVALDAAEGTIDLKKGAGAYEHPTALVPGPPLDQKGHRAAVRRVAAWTLEHQLQGPGAYRAVRDLLAGAPVRITGATAGLPLARPGESGLDAAVRLARGLDGSTLAIQGPPGSGKTYVGARLIARLVADGKKVGITAHTHKAIVNLLDEVMRAARELGTAVSALQKAEEDEASTSPGVLSTTKNEDIALALQTGSAAVVAGTSWLFSREELDGKLDVLVVDEAGQLSLANVVAVGTAAKNLVLLGDPNQLAQPSHSAHPAGAGASALEHVLAGHQTIPPERGLFLATTRRLHPDICGYISESFYEGRLEPDVSCEKRRIAGPLPLGGAGLRYVPVEHAGCRTTSAEEVDRVAVLVGMLVGLSFRTGDTQRPLTLADILVVAPYNAHVARLAAALPPGARVGTVDKFQGQEAAAVIFSMASSSVDDVPRGMEFLFDRHRLNVAMSRGQALAILVCSPALLRVRCHTPEQMRLANALCRYVELATPIVLP